MVMMRSPACVFEIEIAKPSSSSVLMMTLRYTRMRDPGRDGVPPFDRVDSS